MGGFFDWIQQKAEEGVGAAVDVVKGTASTIANNPASAPLAPWIAANEAARATGITGNLPNINTGILNVQQAAQQAAVPAAIPAAVQQQSLRPLTQIPQGMYDMGAGIVEYVRDRPEAIANYLPRYEQNLLDAFNNLGENPTDAGAWMRGLLGAADPYLRIANDPIEQVQFQRQGEGAYYVATHGGQMRDVDAAMPFNYAVQWAVEHPEEWDNIRNAYENGYNGFEGERAVWEYFIGTQNRATRIAADITNDPWNLSLLAGAAGRGVMKGGAAIAGREGAGTAARTAGDLIRYTGKALSQTDTAIQNVLDLPFTVPARGIKYVAGRPSVQPVVRTMLDAIGFKESQESIGRRLSDRAVTALNSLEGRPLDEQALPWWATNREGTGKYEAVMAEPASDPRYGRNTGAAYMVDPEGRPVPGFAWQFSGAHKDLGGVAQLFNRQTGDNAWRPVGRDEGWTGTVVSGDVSGVTAVTPGASIDRSAPLTGPVRRSTIDQGITDPLTPEGGTTPYWFQQTPAQRYEWVQNRGMSVFAPNLGDDRLTTKIEQLRATRPQAAAAFETAIGFDRANGGSVVGTPLAAADRDLAEIGNRFYEDTPEIGGLDAKAVDQKLTTSDFVINQLAPAYARATGIPERPSLTRKHANSTVEDMANTLFSAEPGSETRRAAMIGLFERSIFAQTDDEAAAAMSVLMQVANDQPWMQARLDYANNLRRGMTSRRWVVTPDVTAPTMTPAPKSRFQSLMEAAALETDPVRLAALEDEMRQIITNMVRNGKITPGLPAMGPFPETPRPSAAPAPAPSMAPMTRQEPIPGGFDPNIAPGQPFAPSTVPMVTDASGLPTPAREIPLAISPRIRRLQEMGLNAQDATPPPPDATPPPPDDTPPPTGGTPATPPQNPPTGTGGAAPEPRPSAAPATEGQTINRDPVGNYIMPLDDGRQIIAYKEPDGTFDVVLYDPDDPTNMIELSQAVRAGNVETTMRRVAARAPRSTKNVIAGYQPQPGVPTPSAVVNDKTRTWRTPEEVYAEELIEEGDYAGEIERLAIRTSEMERTGKDIWDGGTFQVETPAGARTVNMLDGVPQYEVTPNGVMYLRSEEGGWEYIAPNGTTYTVDSGIAGGYSKNLVRGSNGDSFDVTKKTALRDLNDAYGPVGDPATTTEFGHSTVNIGNYTVMANKVRKNAAQKKELPYWWVQDAEGNVIADHLTQPYAINVARRRTIDEGRPAVAATPEPASVEQSAPQVPRIETPQPAPTAEDEFFPGDIVKDDLAASRGFQRFLDEGFTNKLSPDVLAPQIAAIERELAQTTSKELRYDLETALKRYRQGYSTEGDRHIERWLNQWGTENQAEWDRLIDEAIANRPSKQAAPQVPRIETPQPRVEEAVTQPEPERWVHPRDPRKVYINRPTADGNWELVDEFTGRVSQTSTRDINARMLEEGGFTQAAAPTPDVTPAGEPLPPIPYGTKVVIAELDGTIQDGIVRGTMPNGTYKVELSNKRGYNRTRPYSRERLEPYADQAATPAPPASPIEHAAPAIGNDPANLDVKAPQEQADIAASQIKAQTGDTGVIMVRTDSLSTDPSRFQPRRGLNEDAVRDSAERWAAGDRPPPLEVWLDPADGKTYILAGHHRLAGARTAGIEEIAVMPFRGTEEQAITRAATSNTQLAQSDLENAGVARMLRDQGRSWKDIRRNMNLTSEDKAKKLVAASYAPQTAKEFAKIPTERGGASLNLLASLGQPVQDGVATADEMARLFDFLTGRDGALPSPEKIDNFMAVAQIQQEAAARGAMDPTAPVKAQSLFDMTGLDGGGVVNDAIKFIEEIGDAKKMLETQRSALVTARNKGTQTQITLRDADDAIKKIEAELEILQERIRRFSVRDAFGVEAAPTPASEVIDQPAPVPMEATRTVQTEAGEQFVMPGTEDAMRPVFGQADANRLAVPPSATPEELTLSTQPEVPIEEETFAQRQAREKAAGQTDMFGFRYKHASPEVQAWMERMVEWDGPLERMPEPVGDTLVDEWVRRGELSTWEAESIRQMYPGLDKPLIDEYTDRLRRGMSPYEARSDIRNTIYKAHISDRALPKNKLARALVKSWRAIDKFTAMVRQNMMYNLANFLAGGFGDFMGNSVHLWQTGRMDEIVDSANTFHLAFGGEPAIADVFSRDFDEVLAGQNRNIPEQIIPRSGQVYETKLGMKDDNLIAWDWGKAVSQKFGREDIPRGFKLLLNFVASPRARSFRQGLDANSKSVLFKGVLDAQLDDEVLRFTRSLENAGMPADATLAAIRRHATDTRAPSGWKSRNPEGTLRHFDSTDVLAVTKNQQLARDWRAAQSRMFRNASNEVKRTFFAGAPRFVADDVFSRVMFYHYWQTRALALQARSMIRNPRVLGGYYRMIQGAMNESDRNGYPSTFRGMMHYWGDTFAGWYGLFNPLGVLVPAMMFSELAYQQGEHSAWQKVQSILPLTPMVAGAAAVLGLADSTPNMFGTTRVQNIVADVVNWGNAHGFDFTLGLAEGSGFVADPVQQITKNILQGLNVIAQQVGAPPFNPYDPVSGKLDTASEVVIQLAKDQWGSDMSQWTEAQNAELQDALLALESGATGNPLAEEAMRQTTDAYLKNRFFATFIPQGSVIRYGPREQARNAARAGDDMAGYQRDLATAPRENRELLIAEQNLANVGTEQGRALWEAWNTIAYGNQNKGTLTVLGQTIDARDLSQLSDEDRATVADAVIAEAGGTDALKAYRDERNAYIRNNPQLANLDQYRDVIREYPGGIRAFRTWAAEVSPQFAREQEELRDYKRKQGKSALLIEAELDMWARSRAGYLAFRGQNLSRYDIPALPGATNANDPSTILALIQQLRGGDGSAGQRAGQSQQQVPWTATGPMIGRVTW